MSNVTKVYLPSRTAILISGTALLITGLTMLYKALSDWQFIVGLSTLIMGSITCSLAYGQEKEKAD